MEISINHLLLEPAWWVLTIIASAFAFIITYVSIPTIVTVSKSLNLYESTSSRGSHNGSIPTLGGVAIVFGFIISASMFMPEGMIVKYRFVLAALILLFFIGIKDDLLVINPIKKFVIQLLAALIVTILGDIRITNFQGFFGIEEIPYIVSIGFTLFVYIVIINGVNLIDGIDGLASGVGILVSLSFGIMFILNGEYAYAAGPFIIIGALIAFFRYNVFSKKNKIFLGDTGSLTLGFLIAVFTINMLEQDHDGGIFHEMISVPTMTFAVLIVPLFDTLRVFILRIFGGDSPFSADRKHIHHRLLGLGFSHIKSTLIILCANLIIIGLAFIFRDLRGSLNLMILLFVAGGLSYIPVYLMDKRGRTL